MINIILPLRARSLKDIQTIIILNQEPLPTYIAKEINQFPKVFFIQGSPLRSQDLDRVCVQKAQALVILQKQSESENNSSGMDTIFIISTVRLQNPNIQIITEVSPKVDARAG